ncbi:MAG: hypothetical protein II336_04150 [Loktanella sp.]|nr:hypothetical protein [Loktanella sp.]
MSHIKATCLKPESWGLNEPAARDCCAMVLVQRNASRADRRPEQSLQHQPHHFSNALQTGERTVAQSAWPYGKSFHRMRPIMRAAARFKNDEARLPLSHKNAKLSAHQPRSKLNLSVRRVT